MKTLKITYILAGSILLFTACRKSVSDAAEEAAQAGGSNRPYKAIADTAVHPPVVDSSKLPPPFPISTPLSNDACSILPIYGDTIIYTQPTAGGQDYIYNVVNSPGTGKYFAWPQGMTIDPNTGAINLSKSETGMKYAIGFVKDGTTDTCLSVLVVGGAAYMDSVYVIEDGYDKAKPYFDANPYLPPVCNGSGPGSGCTFDVTGSAAGDHVIVNSSSGEIDLKKTLNGTGLLGGAFGLLPVNGSTFVTNIYYRLNDPSNNALQHISVQFQYFYSRSSVGAGLLGSVVNKVNNLLSGNLISNFANPRPPLIIIVRRGF